MNRNVAVEVRRLVQLPQLTGLPTPDLAPDPERATRGHCRRTPTLDAEALAASRGDGDDLEQCVVLVEEQHLSGHVDFNSGRAPTRHQGTRRLRRGDPRQRLRTRNTVAAESVHLLESHDRLGGPGAVAAVDPDVVVKIRELLLECSHPGPTVAGTHPVERHRGGSRARRRRGRRRRSRCRRGARAALGSHPGRLARGFFPRGGTRREGESTRRDQYEHLPTCHAQLNLLIRTLATRPMHANDTMIEDPP